MTINRTVFKIEKMDCPSEEQMVRMKLDGVKGIHTLDFNIPEKQLTVYHKPGILDVLSKKLDELDFNSRVILSSFPVYFVY